MEKEKKSWFSEHLVSVILGLFTLIASCISGWFVYNQHTRDTMTDLRIEQMKQENKEKAEITDRNVAVIYGDLWELLIKVNADRVYIIQPHPQSNYHYLSTFFEVSSKGVKKATEIIKNVPMQEVPIFSKEISTNSWIFYNNMDEQVRDERVKAIIKLAGAKQVAILQLVNINGKWNGNLVASRLTNNPFDEKDLHKEMKNTASMIQYILPAFDEELK